MRKVSAFFETGNLFFFSRLTTKLVSKTVNNNGRNTGNTFGSTHDESL
jgi:hypothetical protein